MTDSKLVYAAIDFGTTYSGYAFAFRSELEKDILKIHGKNWQHSRLFELSKTPTVILFDDRKRFDSFGHEAEEKYAKLAKEYKAKGWRYFKHFKMALHGKKKLGLNLKIKDDQGRQMPAIDVFAAAIRYLKDDLLKTLQKWPNIESGDIMWIITVPTIWSYGAKQFMKEAAVRAGISHTQFTFALEPEAGALCCKLYASSKGTENILREGSHFMVIDLGGGTADITVSKVEEDETLSELYPPSGGPWGGARVDQNIYRLLEDRFGIDIFQKMDQYHKTDSLFVRDEIERKKREFQVNDSKVVRFHLPYQLVGMYRVSGSELNSDLQLALDDSVILDESKNLVCISNTKFEEMFSEPKENLIRHLQDLFAHSELASVNTLLMIGGFSNSKIMQEAVKSCFPNKRVVISEEADLAVMKGAVMFGYKSKWIRSRKLPYTFGVSTAVPFDGGIHRKNKYFFPPGSEYPKCEDIFAPFISKGTTIVPGITRVNKTDFTVDPSTTSAQIEVYQSFADRPRNPIYIDDEDVDPMGVLELSLEQQRTTVDRRTIDISMHFGAVEVVVEAKERGSNSAVTAKFNCLYH